LTFADRGASGDVSFTHLARLVERAAGGLPLAMLLVLLLLALAYFPAPHSDRIQTHDLGKLTWRPAQRLNGQPVRAIFTVDSL
jgi:hypothetical protein